MDRDQEKTLNDCKSIVIYFFRIVDNGLITNNFFFDDIKIIFIAEASWLYLKLFTLDFPKGKNLAWVKYNGEKREV